MFEDKVQTFSSIKVDFGGSQMYFFKPFLMLSPYLSFLISFVSRILFLMLLVLRV